MVQENRIKVLFLKDYTREKGINFINEHLEEIKQAPTRINKNK